MARAATAARTTRPTKKVAAPTKKPARQVRVRIDVRREPGSDFIEGPPEPPGAMTAEDVANLNEVLGWEKYRLVELDDAAGEGSG